MQYDTTGPATANETRSLLVMLCLIGAVVLALWGLMPAAPQRSAVTSSVNPPIFPATLPSTVPAKSSASAHLLPDGVTRRDDELTIVKAGGNVVHIYQNDADVWPTRSFDPDNKAEAEEWQLGAAVMAIARNPRAAERYDAVNAVEKLKALDTRPPQLTLAERAQLRQLFLVAQEAKGADKVKADQALMAAVASMPILPEQRKSFDTAIAQAKTILTPEQLHWIRIGGRPPAPKPAHKPATRPARRAPGRPAIKQMERAATTSRPAK